MDPYPAESLIGIAVAGVMRDKSRRRTGCPRGDRIGRSRTRAARTRRQTPARSRCRRCPVHDCCLAPVAPPHARERHSLETSRTRDISLSLLLSLLFHREHRQGTDKQNSFRAKKRPATSSSETECVPVRTSPDVLEPSCLPFRRILDGICVGCGREFRCRLSVNPCSATAMDRRAG